ncbi:MAG: DoxX family protein [Saprospiraceae bacterium]|nr:DoxX family protein [Saprospiraceae bacterium]
MLPQLAVSLFMAILFLQSGLDKVFHYRGNLAYFSAHFKKSPLAGMVSLMMPVITLLEVSAGALSAAGAVQLLLSGTATLAFYGQAVAAAALLCLFFGQRLAQDYGGAAALVPYFLTALAGMWLTKGA